MTSNVCGACGEGHTTPRIHMALYKYKGHTTMLPLHYVECDKCGSELAGDEESRENKYGVLMFLHKIDTLPQE